MYSKSSYSVSFHPTPSVFPAMSPTLFLYRGKHLRRCGGIVDSSEIVFPIWGKYDDATHMPNLIYQIRAYSRILSINAPCLLIIMEKSVGSVFFVTVGVLRIGIDPKYFRLRPTFKAYVKF